MPEGTDPDDYIKKNGKTGLINLLKRKEIIESFIWNYHLSKIDQSNPILPSAKIITGIFKGPLKKGSQKNRDILTVKKDINEKDITSIVMKSSKAKKHIENKEISKTIFVKNKIINYILNK